MSLFIPIWLYVSSVADLVPHHFGKLDPDPHLNGKPELHQSKQLDPVPHQSKKVESIEGHFEALEGLNLEKK
jgi:hypothetical protein